jgi:hypothetical protein
MTELNIKKLGFERIDITAEESGDIAFYYYGYKIGHIDLISNSNDNTQEGKWIVEILEGDIQFHDYTELKNVINILEKNKIS